MTMYYPGPYGQPMPRRSARRIAIAVGLLTALALTGAAAAGIDAVRGYMVQARLTRAVDEAALAGGRILFEDQRHGHIRKFFDSAFPPGFLGAEAAPLAIADDPQSGTLTVRGTAKVQATFLRLLGYGDMVVEARSVVRRSVRGESAATTRRPTL